MVKNDDTSRTFVFSTEVIDELLEQVDQGRVLKRYNNPWFKNIPGVRRPKAPWAWTQEELEEFSRCKEDVHYFAEKYCRIKREDGTYGPMSLRDYQKDIVDLYTNNRYSILMASRQTGKTVSAAIVILHFITFNIDKGVMIVANKSKTVIEIIDKIKSIYLSLPYFLKAGVTNWSTRSINFDNGCKIKSEARTKEPSIGFTIDMLYMDEFAHIPKNIVGHFYRSVVPTVSSIENSKIIITSTPNGFNLFHELWEGANLKKGDPKKNPYKPLKVLWSQVPGRQDSKLYMNQYDMERLGLTKRDIEFILEEMGVVHVPDAKMCARMSLQGKDSYYWRTEQTDDNMIVDVLCVGKTDAMTLETVSNIEVPISGGGYRKLHELGEVTNWEKKETLLIGGIENFNQEYNLHFLAGSKRLLEPDVMNFVVDGRKEYEYVDMPQLRKLWFECKELRWSKDLSYSITAEAVKNNYYLVTGDLGEGGGGDGTCFHIFELRPKTKEDLERTVVKTLQDCYKFVQIGTYNYNRITITEAAHLLYVIVFDILNPDRTKVAIEMNQLGGEFMAKLPHVFNDNNQFGTYPFLRFKHKVDAVKPKLGIKVTPGNKKQMVIDFKAAIKSCSLALTDPETINDLTNFVKIEKASGNDTYAAETGHDDTVMAAVHGSNAIDNNVVKIMVQEYHDNCDSYVKAAVTEAMNESEYCDTGSYSTIRNAVKSAKNGTARRTRTFSGRFVRK